MYRNEQFKRNKKESIAHVSAWLESRQDWDLLAVTVTFKPIDAHNNEERWIQEYRNRVLYRISRRLEHNKERRKDVIPYTDIVYFDQNYHSIFKSTKLSNPPHVHAIIPIPNKLTYRVWDFEKSSLLEAVKNDIFSMKTVGSLHVGLISPGSTNNWLNYILKGDKEL